MYIAIGLLKGSVNTDVFTCWVDKVLLTNLPEKALLSWIMLLYSATYSPDLNPIEKNGLTLNISDELLNFLLTNSAIIIYYNSFI